VAGNIPSSPHLKKLDLQILRWVIADLDLSYVFRSGFTPSQVSKRIKVQLDAGLLKRDQGKLLTTTMGRQLFKALSEGKNSFWIEPASEFVIEKINSDDIIIPRRSSLKDIAESLASGGNAAKDGESPS
jgi:hypothetical protein